MADVDPPGRHEAAIKRMMHDLGLGPTQVAEQQPTYAVLEAVTDVVVSHLKGNATEPEDLLVLIENLHDTAIRLLLRSYGHYPPPKSVHTGHPRIPVASSITEDAIYCLQCGLGFKSLKRHLPTHGLSFEDYRRRFGLPSSYPSVSPSYSRERARLARTNGLGKRPPQRPDQGRPTGDEHE